MKKLIVLGGMLVLLGCWTGTGFSDEDTTAHIIYINVSEVALLNAVGADPLFTIGAPVDAFGGEAFAVSSSNEDAKWLQYTSIVSAEEETIKITAAIDNAADIPDGAILRVTAKAPESGVGNLGTNFFSSVALSTDSEDIVTGIGSGYTGTGGSEGVQLTYELDLDIDTAADLYAYTYTVEVTYTLTASE